MSVALAGIIGWPVAQSLSPRLHSYWLRKYRLDAAYVPLAVRPEDFSTVVDALRRAGFVGVNVTVPHKIAAFAIAHRSDPAAKASEGANLLLFKRGGLIEAKNTDSRGLAASLAETLGKTALRAKSAVLLGAGGAARAAVVALDSLGAREVRVANRNRAHAATMTRALQPHVKARLSAHELQEWPAIAADVSLVVNATSAGMKGSVPINLRLEALPKAASVCDLVYNPLETRLLKRAKALKLRVVDGLGMLMHQAAPSFEAFFGVEPEVTPALRNYLESALRGR